MKEFRVAPWQLSFDPKDSVKGDQLSDRKQSIDHQWILSHHMQLDHSMSMDDLVLVFRVLR